MSAIERATPKYISHGVRDDSTRTVSVEPINNAQFLILAPIFTYKGTTTPTIVNGNAFDAIFGKESLDETSPYFTHQSLLVKEILAIGGQVMVQRITTPESKEATLTLYAECYNLKEGGVGVNWIYANTLEQLKAVSAETSVQELNELPLKHDNFRPNATQQTVNGAAIKLSEATGNTTLRRILRAEVTGVGSHGNEYGIRFIHANSTNQLSHPNTILTKKLGIRVYELEVVKRNLVTNKLTIIRNKFGDTSSTVVLAANQYHPHTNEALSLDEVLKTNYSTVIEDMEYPLFTNVVVNYNNVVEMQMQIWGGLPGERPNNPFVNNKLTDSKDTVYTVDLLFGKALNGKNRDDLVIRGNGTFNSIHFNFGATVFFTQGIQNLLEESIARTIRPSLKQKTVRYTALYEELVYDWMEYHTSQETYLRDKARFPFRDLVDSGFSFMVKDLLPLWTTLRKDINVITSTFSILPYPKIKESSNNTSLNIVCTGSSPALVIFIDECNYSVSATYSDGVTKRGVLTAGTTTGFPSLTGDVTDIDVIPTGDKIEVNGVSQWGVVLLNKSETSNIRLELTNLTVISDMTDDEKIKNSIIYYIAGNDDVVNLTPIPYTGPAMQASIDVSEIKSNFGVCLNRRRQTPASESTNKLIFISTQQNPKILINLKLKDGSVIEIDGSNDGIMTASTGQYLNLKSSLDGSTPFTDTVYTGILPNPSLSGYEFSISSTYTEDMTITVEVTDDFGLITNSSLGITQGPGRVVSTILTPGNIDG